MVLVMVLDVVYELDRIQDAMDDYCGHDAA